MTNGARASLPAKSFRIHLLLAHAFLAAAAATLAGCGGGGGGGPVTPPPPTGGSYVPGVFQPASSFAQQCDRPRTGTNPITGQPYPDRAGTAIQEKNFLRSWTNELYLWYAEVPDINPTGFTTAQYFDELKTPAKTASGRPKDRFHFTYPTDVWEALSRSGVESGYGAEWVLVSAMPPRRIVIAYVEPNTPAAAANLSRGMEVITADGVDVINGNTQGAVDALNAAFFPETVGEHHTFSVRDLDQSTRPVSLTSAAITHTPVLVTSTLGTTAGPVGYMVFNDHIAPAEAALVNAIDTLRTQNIVDLVLDIRYNGGGYLDIASELAYMIGGTATVGQSFERLVFNAKHPSTNPVTGEPLAPTPFHSTAQGFSPSLAAGTALPTLNLPRVYVITGPNTCSASESIINALRGIGVHVYQIGATTCGKPYGFYAQENCGTTYFSIQFQGLNAQNFGDYPDGFSPQNASESASVDLPGCAVADDFTRALGNVDEARLAAVLAFREGNNQPQACPAATSFGPDVMSKPGRPLSQVDGVMIRTPARENRILR